MGATWDCLEMAVWLWGPHLDTFLLGKTCRIRFCRNEEHLQPGVHHIVGTRWGIPMSLHGGTHAHAAESWCVPCPCWHMECHAFCWQMMVEWRLLSVHHFDSSPIDAEAAQIHWWWFLQIPQIDQNCIFANKYLNSLMHQHSFFIGSKSYKEKSNETSQIWRQKILKSARFNLIFLLYIFEALIILPPSRHLFT